jgi:hypothetical protein
VAWPRNQLRSQRNPSHGGAEEGGAKRRVETVLLLEMKAICRASHLGLPCLPVQAATIKVAFVWVSYCNGTTVFPKPPLYLQWHHKKWLRNEQTRVAVEKAAYKCQYSFLNTNTQLESASNVASSLVLRLPPIATKDNCSTQQIIWHWSY